MEQLRTCSCVCGIGRCSLLRLRKRSDWFACFNQVGAIEIQVFLCPFVFSSWRHRRASVICVCAFPGHVVMITFFILNTAEHTISTAHRN